MMSDNPQHNSTAELYEDTISLIDLLAVVVRHRRLIIGGTVLVAVAAVLILYGLPLLTAGPEEAADDGTYVVEQRIIVRPILPMLQDYVSADPRGAFQGILRDPGSLVPLYEQFLLDPESERAEWSPGRLRQYLTETFLSEDFSTSWDANTNILTVSLRTADREAGRQFVDMAISRANDEFTGLIGPQLEDEVVRLDTRLETMQETVTRSLSTSLRSYVEAPGRTEEITRDVIVPYLEEVEFEGLDTMAEMIVAREEIARLSEDAGGLFRHLGDATVYEAPPEVGTSRSMVVIISTITAFFLTVFLAFVLEYARRVRQDPEEMGKLRAAWRQEDV